MKTILLKSQKDVAVIYCPKCGTIYSMSQEFIANTLPQIPPMCNDDDELRIGVRCPHCFNVNNYTTAVWYEHSELGTVVEQRKVNIEK